MSVGVVNKQTGDRIPTAGMPAIDNALDLTSSNPVQNAVITAALADKQDKSDNNLQTTDKTVVGAVNELKSGLTNVEGWNKLLAFRQTDKAATLSFSGTASGRSWIAEIVVAGQSGVTSTINVSTGGASDTVVNLSETYLRVTENSYGISGSTGADGTIRIGAGIYGNWGAIYVRSIHDRLKNATISIAYDS